MQSLWIDGPMPGLNELINQAKTPALGRILYNQVKRRWADNIGMAIKRSIQPFIAMPKAYFEFFWVEASKRRDPDNVSSGGRKLILDSLVKYGILPNDGWGEVLGWNDCFSVNKERPGVLVRMYLQAPIWQSAEENPSHGL